MEEGHREARRSGGERAAPAAASIAPIPCDAAGGAASCAAVTVGFGGAWTAAAALITGFLIARFVGDGGSERWALAGLALATVGWVVRGDAGRRAARIAATTCLGAAWFLVSPLASNGAEFPAAADLPPIVRVTGVVLRGPDLDPGGEAGGDPGGDPGGEAATGPSGDRVAPPSLADFGYRPATTTFRIALRNLNGSPARGRVTVRLDATIEAFHAGARVEAVGRLFAPPSPTNPGERDRRRTSGRAGRLGTLVAGDRGLIVATDVPPWHPRRARAALRGAAARALIEDLPRARHPSRDALLRMLILGKRTPPDPSLEALFRRTGVAHVLAISGLHLGIVVGLAMLVLRTGGTRRRTHGLLIIAIVIAFLTLVETRVPVVRAALMVVGIAAGIVAGRRWRVDRVLAVAAILLLLWRPDELYNPGFQLSFGVVLGLLTLAPRVHERWFGARRRGEAGVGDLLAHWLRRAISSTVVAWTIATPITLFHFGLAAPLAVPITLVALPLVTALLGLGYAKIALTAVMPSAAIVVGHGLAACAELLLAAVGLVDRLPGATLVSPRPSIVWTMAALAGVIVWACALASRRVCAAGAITLGAWLLATGAPARTAALVRIDMLDVGHGSCVVVRTAGRTLVFDAGSTSDSAVGRRTLAPALRALGVRRVDRLVLSHSDLDHYGGAIELADAVPVAQVLVTPQFVASRNRSGATAHLLVALRARGIPVVTATAGDRFAHGAAMITCLHPMPGDRFAADNDTSLVVSLAAAGRHVLLLGDLEIAGIGALRDRSPALRADVMELPHHGADTPAARALVAALDPMVVLQSAGPSRFARDPWQADMDDRFRLVTARDGASWVEIDERGVVRAGSWGE